MRSVDNVLDLVKASVGIFTEIPFNDLESACFSRSVFSVDASI